MCDFVIRAVFGSLRFFLVVYGEGKAVHEEEGAAKGDNQTDLSKMSAQSSQQKFIKDNAPIGHRGRIEHGQMSATGRWACQLRSSWQG